MAELRTYNQKRNFKQTSEPPGKKDKNFARDFMVHMHDARKLHYDVRLQWDGVLLSWAVPKGPSFDPEDKRLAVRTEDHPVEYKAFEGIIPEKNYGAGPSLIWDAGTWRPLVKDMKRALKDGKVKFYLRGARLRGIWNLVRMRGKWKKDASKEQWLMIKENDKFARSDWNIEDHASSVATGRSVEEVLRLDESVEEVVVDAVDDSAYETRDDTDLADAPKVPTQELANWTPQMATLTKRPPRNMDDWIVEKKYDGYRLVAVKSEGAVALVTRSGLDWSAKFPWLVKTLQEMPIENIVLDGEVVAYKGQDQNESFGALQNHLKSSDSSSTKTKGKNSEEYKVKYIIFDVLSADKVELRKQPLWFRRNFLENLYKKIKTPVLEISETQKWSETLYNETCEQKREGLMIKHTESTYREGRSKEWLKLKCGTRDEYVVIGWTEPKGTRTHFGALLLAELVDEKLVYRGKVGTGFDGRKLSATLKKLDARSVDECPISDCEDAPDAHWVEPYYFAEVRYAEMSGGRRLRQPVFLGLRDDKFYEVETLKSAARETRVRITHPDKILFKDVGLSKADLLTYYHAVFAEFIKLGGHRPLSLVRCPNGSDKPCFFQKHIDVTGKHPPQLDIKTKSSVGNYAYIKTFDDLAALIQMGALELHGWNCHVKAVEKPQFVVWDLDPGEGVAFAAITQTAHLIRLVLEKMGRPAYVRTSGGKGLHVLTPIQKMSWAEGKEFSKEIGQLLADAKPDLYLITSKKSIRKNRIFIDYLRNSRSATSILNFSTRAREGAPVSYPLFWREVNETLDPLKYTVKTVPTLLKKRKSDPWAEFYDQISP